MAVRRKSRTTAHQPDRLKSRKFSARLRRWLEADHPRGDAGRFRAKGDHERKTPPKGGHAQPQKGIHPTFVMGDDGVMHKVKKASTPKAAGASALKASEPRAPKVSEPRAPRTPKVSKTDEPANTPDPGLSRRQASQDGGGSGRGDLGSLRKVMDDHPEPGPARNKAIADWVESHRGKTTTSVKTHGMPDAEEMHSLTVSGRLNDHVDLEGVTFHFPKDADPSFHPLARTLNYLDNSLNPISVPSSLSKHTKNIYFSSQASKDKAYWNAKYNLGGSMDVGATAGDGNMVVYLGKTVNPRVLAHEMGHNLSKGRYGSSDPPDSSDFGRASRSGEQPATNYGRNNISEDFAESVMLYTAEPASLKSKAPKRYQVIKKLLEDESYGG